MKRTFDDVDDLAVEAKQWSLDFRQLDRGPFRGRMLQFGAHGVHVAEARFDRQLHQRGIPPLGMRTVAVPACPSIRFKWRGHQIDGQSLMVFPRDGELSSVSRPDFHVYTCSFPEALLGPLGETFGVGDPSKAFGDAEAVRVEPSVMESVRRSLRGICGSVRENPAMLSDRLLASQLTRALPGNLIGAIASASGKCPPLTGPKRLAALSRAEAFIEQHARDPIRVSDLCQIACVSERTLEYAFLDRFGMGPKEYLNAVRLFSARRQLRAADPRTTKVVDVANAWGFWHMGQFAADYRKRFDELPSKTLRRESSQDPLAIGLADRVFTSG